MWRSNSFGRAWVAIRSASRKPRVVTSSVRSPRRSRSAFVATVVPIFTQATCAGVIGRSGRQAEQAAYALDRGIRVLIGGFGEQFQIDETAVRTARDHVGERAAAIDPELPAIHRGVRHQRAAAFAANARPRVSGSAPAASITSP